ncbi:MAG TPA: hypothetical protein V6D22_20925 [Candidatus Obscuribacterales bacterium]
MGHPVIQALPPRSQQLLEKFGQAANKSTGISEPRDFERFCKFVVMAHEENVELPDHALREYLQEHGWPAEQAEITSKRFTAACLLLKMYDDFRHGSLKL